jgi:aminoglycoside 3-N-acetyltransferase I
MLGENVEPLWGILESRVDDKGRLRIPAGLLPMMAAPAEWMLVAGGEGVLYLEPGTGAGHAVRVDEIGRMLIPRELSAGFKNRGVQVFYRRGRIEVVMKTGELRIERLTAGDSGRARELFLTLAGVFETEAEPLGEEYLESLLRKEAFWAFAATMDGRIAGGLTAHTLPMTRTESAEIFIYDIAVVPEHQRKGIGRRLVAALRAAAAAAGIGVLFVAADNEDEHALDFYQAIGGEAGPVTIFTFTEEAGRR